MAELFIERQQGGEDALLVTVQFPDSSDINYEISEFNLLSKSAGANIIDSILVKRSRIEIKYFIGKGKLEEINSTIKLKSINLVIFNHNLTPAQERNLEEVFECRVLDRTGLILDIFASRARSHAGKLQVELAQLRHLSTRLIRGWTHLERQKGGIGLRGPGETQLESDKRMIGLRIKQISKRLSKVNATRKLGRKSRKKAELATVSLVGYTNAGKSTLFNSLVKSEVYAADQLFATLDSTLRKLKVSAHLDIILADTVGFVSRLPHPLIESFKSTLEETLESDLLLHVVDISQDNYVEQRLDVLDVLEEIGADNVRVLEVMNKIDALDNFAPRIDYDDFGSPYRVWVSALTGSGLELINECLGDIFQKNMLKGSIILGFDEADIRSHLYDKADIIAEEYDVDGNCCIDIVVEKQVLEVLGIYGKFIRN